MELERRDLLRHGLALLAQRERSRKELHECLSRRCRNEALLIEVLDSLAERGLQSDVRCAAEFVRTRIARGQGPVKIRRDLAQRGISAALIEASLSAGEGDWCSLAEQVRSQRYGEKLPGARREIMRQARFLSGRGFCDEHICQLFDMEC